MPHPVCFVDQHVIHLYREIVVEGRVPGVIQHRGINRKWRGGGFAIAQLVHTAGGDIAEIKHRILIAGVVVVLFRLALFNGGRGAVGINP